VLIQYLILHQSSRLLALRRASARPTTPRLGHFWRGNARETKMGWLRTRTSCIRRIVGMLDTFQSTLAELLGVRHLGVSAVSLSRQGESGDALGPVSDPDDDASCMISAQSIRSSSSIPEIRAVVAEAAATDSLGLSNPSNTSFTVPSTFLQSLPSQPGTIRLPAPQNHSQDTTSGRLPRTSRR
jgi:hypothetical protein